MLVEFMADQGSYLSLTTAWDLFYKQPPEPKYEITESDIFHVISSQHRQLLKERADIDKLIKENETVLKNFSDNPVKGFGCTVSIITRIGAVDYKAIPELVGVDLDAYRKKSTTYKAIKHDKAEK